MQQLKASTSVGVAPYEGDYAPFSPGKARFRFGGATRADRRTFTLGFFNWLAFVYIGIRARHPAWTIAGFAYLVPLILTLASIGTPLFRGLVAFQIFVSAASVAHALYLRPYYRALMFGDAPRTSPPAPPRTAAAAARRTPAAAAWHRRRGGRGHPRRPAQVDAVRATAGTIAKRAVQDKVVQLCRTADQILDEPVTKPRKVDAARSFLPTMDAAQRIVDGYAHSRRGPRPHPTSRAPWRAPKPRSTACRRPSTASSTACSKTASSTSKARSSCSRRPSTWTTSTARPAGWRPRTETIGDGSAHQRRSTPGAGVDSGASAEQVERMFGDRRRGYSRYPEAASARLETLMTDEFERDQTGHDQSVDTQAPLPAVPAVPAPPGVSDRGRCRLRAPWRPADPGDKAHIAEIVGGVDVTDSTSVISTACRPRAASPPSPTAARRRAQQRRRRRRRGPERAAQKVRELDVDALSPSSKTRLPIVGRFGNVFNRFAAKYQKVAGSIDRIVDALERSRMMLLKDITVLDKMFSSTSST